MPILIGGEIEIDLFIKKWDIIEWRQEPGLVALQIIFFRSSSPVTCLHVGDLLG